MFLFLIDLKYILILTRLKMFQVGLYLISKYSALMLVLISELLILHRSCIHILHF